MSAPALRCLGPCGKKFSKKDVEELNYFPEIAMCYNCCKGLQEKPIVVDCFGKATTTSPQGKITGYAYDSSAQDCRLYCELRNICKVFVSGKLEREREEIQLTKINPFQRGTMMWKIFRKCLKGTTTQKIEKMVNEEGRRYHKVIRKLEAGRLPERKNSLKWIFQLSGNLVKIFVKK